MCGAALALACVAYVGVVGVALGESAVHPPVTLPDEAGNGEVAGLVPGTGMPGLLAGAPAGTTPALPSPGRTAPKRAPRTATRTAARTAKASTGTATRASTKPTTKPTTKSTTTSKRLRASGTPTRTRARAAAL